MQYFFLSKSNNGYANMPQNYVYTPVMLLQMGGMAKAFNTTQQLSSLWGGVRTANDPGWIQMRHLQNRSLRHRYTNLLGNLVTGNILIHIPNLGFVNTKSLRMSTTKTVELGRTHSSVTSRGEPAKAGSSPRPQKSITLPHCLLRALILQSLASLSSRF